MYFNINYIYHDNIEVSNTITEDYVVYKTYESFSNMFLKEIYIELNTNKCSLFINIDNEQIIEAQVEDFYNMFDGISGSGNIVCSKNPRGKYVLIIKNLNTYILDKIDLKLKKSTNGVLKCDLHNVILTLEKERIHK